MLNYLQKIGKSLMLPVSVLVVASLFMGAGYAIDPMALEGGANPVAVFLIQVGLVVIDNLPILFAIGIATGLAEESHGSSALSASVGYLMMVTLLNPEKIAMFTNVSAETVNPAFLSINNVFIGIIAGIMGGELYNRFYKTELPQWLAFFSGRRLVPILTAICSVLVSIILFFAWPALYGSLQIFGEFIAGLGALGAGIYGTLNKLVIPFGLHHALNNVFWFDTIGINDIGNFWASEGVLGITGMYQAGFFPIMMFGLPAAAFAIYKNANPENKNRVGALMLASGVASFITGITEPLEFSFMFASPLLYGVHTILTGLSMFIAALLKATAGFSFSAGLIDFILSFKMPLANKPWLLLIIGLVMAVLYFLIFDFMIKKLDLNTPGRGKEVIEEDDTHTNEGQTTDSGSKYGMMAQEIYEAVGGAENIDNFTNCATRLRFVLKDTSLVNKEKISRSGAPGQMQSSKHNYQIIIGTNVQFVADEFKTIYNKNTKDKVKDF